MRLVTGIVGMAAALVAGCVAEAPEVGVEAQEIVGGNEAVPGQWSSVVAIDYLLDGQPFICGGTYIAPGWVLTAAHCFVEGNNRVPQPGREPFYKVSVDRHDLMNDTGGIYADIKRIVPHPSYTGTGPGNGQDNDLALVELSQPLPIPTMTLAGKYEMKSVRIGEVGRVVGWGRSRGDQPPHYRLWEANVDVVGAGADCVARSSHPSVTANQVCLGSSTTSRACRGDSGGPGMIRRGNEWVQLGIVSWGGPQCDEPNEPGVYTLVPNYREWIWQQIHRGATRFTRTDHDGDFQDDLVFTNEWGSSLFLSDPDGNWSLLDAWTDIPFLEVDVVAGRFNSDPFGDLLVVTPLGSFWQTSFGDGTFDIPYARADQPLGSVRYVPLDFTGDGRTDLVIQNQSGSYWYSGTAAGTYYEVARRTDLPLGVAEYVVGNFDGTNGDDLVITTPSGSYWYFSNGNGTFSQPYVRTDLPLGRVAYVPGDFDGNGKTDLVVTDKSGSYWYLSNGDGTWWQPYVRHDLPLGRVRYTPVDLDGNQRTDLVIQTMAGSYAYFSNGNGGFTERWRRTDLPLGIARYTPGYFDVDTNEDLVITTPSGSYWYHSNGDGTFDQRYVRTDLPL